MILEYQVSIYVPYISWQKYNSKISGITTLAETEKASLTTENWILKATGWEGFF